MANGTNTGLEGLFQQQADRFDLFINDSKKFYDDMPIVEIATALVNNIDDETEARAILTSFIIEVWNNNQSDMLTRMEDLADDVAKDLTGGQ